MATKQGNRTRSKQEERTFLVVVDDSDEMQVALRYASLRAKTTGGRVALFTAIEPTDFGHWATVEERAEAEQREEAETMMRRYADRVTELSGKVPIIHIRHGMARDSLLELLEEDPRISIVVLAASEGGKGPGPLIAALTGKFYSKLLIPLMIVPGDLSDVEIDAIT